LQGERVRPANRENGRLDSPVGPVRSLKQFEHFVETLRVSTQLNCRLASVEVNGRAPGPAGRVVRRHDGPGALRQPLETEGRQGEQGPAEAGDAGEDMLAHRRPRS